MLHNELLPAYFNSYNYLAIYGCELSDFNILIYLKAVEGIPSSQESNLICLIANKFSFLSLALYTLPNEP
jgi:hypothetical protein